MVMPNKVVKPIDSLVGISGFIKKILYIDGQVDINSLYKKLNGKYPTQVTVEKYILSLDFLFALGVIDLKDEVIIKR